MLCLNTGFAGIARHEKDNKLASNADLISKLEVKRPEINTRGFIAK
jgi:hypothetical protein